jgi:hypothetical protein
MDPSTVIKNLGGTKAVAQLCGIKPPSVSAWKRQGIPQAREQYLRLLRPEAWKEPRGGQKLGGRA